MSETLKHRLAPKPSHLPPAAPRRDVLWQFPPIYRHFRIFRTTQCYFVAGCTDSSPSTRPSCVLRVDRDSGSCQVVSPSQISSSTSAHAYVDAHAIIGVAQLHSSLFLMAVTKRRCVACVLGAEMFRVMDVELFAIGPPPSQAEDEGKRQRVANTEMREMLSELGLYFSYDVDVTTAFQRQLHTRDGDSMAPLWRKATSDYFWNFHALMTMLGLHPPLRKHTSDEANLPPYIPSPADGSAASLKD
jgi:hypothetical protein